ncbi:MAG: HPr family phosphocarrier protein [Cohaesibacteraceae bacterium]|nr:HPr family phosphocarrier protein [Cohaesibacteraceae bacterium]
MAQPPFNRELLIQNRRGLHARASAKFVQCVERFNASVEVSKSGQTVCGTSIMGLMMLAASPGCSIMVTVDGEEAGDAIKALEDLVNDKFGESE